MNKSLLLIKCVVSPLIVSSSILNLQEFFEKMDNQTTAGWSFGTNAITGWPIDTLATNGWPKDSPPTTGWSLDTFSSTGWKMENLANSGWSMDTLGTSTAWQGSQNLCLQSIREAPNGFKRRHHLDSFGSSSDTSDQVFQNKTTFQVDRRKIESLILGKFNPIKETACDYFLRVGNETGTTVFWPKRLNVGGNKGKNPRIRIGGSTYEAVILAKTIILGHFDCTKNTGIRMKMG